ncbi:MAG: Rrf2 family transcriptional regulator [Bacteroidota bacterium]
MSVLFSRQCEYAIQAVLYLALKPAGEMTSAKELTAKLDVPYHFISKILQDLTYKKLLHSQTGPTGGFALAKSAQKILIKDIVEAVDGVDYATKCVMGFKECGGKNPCAVHDMWSHIKLSINDMLASKSVYELAKESISRT